uniref:Uncharacterized protein n=1 Tax=Anguilla anguilla TaxID=7936 RepID=A0A0E9UIM6_ANGAN
MRISLNSWKENVSFISEIR